MWCHKQRFWSRSPTNTGQTFTTWNLKSDKNVQHKDVDKITFIKTSSILPYIFLVTLTVSLCASMCLNIFANYLLENPKMMGHFDLYDQIANQPLKDQHIHSFIDHNVALDASNIGTFTNDEIVSYENCFSTEQWAKILLFEHHFTIACPHYSTPNPQQQDTERWKYLSRS